MFLYVLDNTEKRGRHIIILNMGEFGVCDGGAFYFFLCDAIRSK